MNSQDRYAVFSAELVAEAEATGAENNRSPDAQLEHWARVGRALSEGLPETVRRVQQALDGEIGIEYLDATESLIFDAVVKAGIVDKLASTDYAAKRAARGLTSVALDDTGAIVEFFPDGTARKLS